MCIRIVNGRGTRHDKTGQGYDQMIRATTEEGNYRQSQLQQAKPAKIGRGAAESR